MERRNSTPITKTYSPTAKQHALMIVASLTILITPILTQSTHAAGLLIADGGMGGILEIQEQTVNVTINNGIAVTEVEQIFLNTESRQVEALYTFPVPKGASVSNFSMWINGKEMIGEVVEKKRAREIYNSYKAVRRDPGLLEQVDYKTFEMRIFPIGAKAQQRVKVTYYQELDFDHDQASYVYPLATVTRENINQNTTGKLAMTLRVLSEVPLVDMQSPSHQDGFVIAKHSANFYEASYETDGGSIARDFVLNFDMARPRTGIDIITSKPDGEDGYFMLTVTAGKELAQLDQPMDYIFVLDVSGSMRNSSKLIMSKNAIYAFVKELSNKDRFEIITFNVQPEQLFKTMQTADQTNLAQARNFLDQQSARGGTSLVPALQAAYSYANPDRQLNVVILSDGMTEQGQRETLMQLINQRPENARIFTIGVGNEVNRPLLSQLANQTNGLAAFISQEDNFERQAQAFRRKLIRPVATNLNLKFDGVEVYDVEPARLPALYYGAPLRVYGRYRNTTEQSTVNIKAEVAGKALNQKAPITLPKTDGGNPQIERMWAWHRINSLLNDNTQANNIPQVIGLGEAYSIVTEYTSFLVLENDSEYKRWKIDRRNALRIKRDRAARNVVNQRLNQLREQAMQQFTMVDTSVSNNTNNSISPNTTTNIAPMRNIPAAKPVPTQPQVSKPRPAPQPRQNRGFDIDFPSFGGGGGAIDPISAGLIASLGGLAMMRRKRRRSA
ncbi:MAG TPA: MprA protease, GlyGly-CTERM protein-sorting domain-containing form [Phycisphaerales bacterium]|nr:MprA protease, GlyGly-CTERM protein-sorting domain-containing form [Phycisphaerales bacterium]|tara:strand:- start:102723 stop:104909 length:2187 start_codon:yes stop_codon:yes gene_type:complete